MEPRAPALFQLPENAYKFQTPCRVLITGQTMAGKSQMVEELLKYDAQLFTHSFDDVFVCLSSSHTSQEQSAIDRLKQIKPSLHTRVGLPESW